MQAQAQDRELPIEHEKHVDAEPAIELELEAEQEAPVVAEQADDLEQWLEDELENNQYSETHT